MKSSRVGTLILVCGLPGAGKTTYAKQIERERQALRMCPDEWIASIIIDKTNGKELERLRQPVEDLLWDLTKQALRLGVNVVAEYGYWSKAERDKFRDQARKLGAKVELHYLKVPKDVMWYRIEKRNANLPEGNFPISKAQFDSWYDYFQAPTAAELATYNNGITV